MNVFEWIGVVVFYLVIILGYGFYSYGVGYEKAQAECAALQEGEKG